MLLSLTVVAKKVRFTSSGRRLIGIYFPKEEILVWRKGKKVFVKRTDRKARKRFCLVKNLGNQPVLYGQAIEWLQTCEDIRTSLRNIKKRHIEKAA